MKPSSSYLSTHQTFVRPFPKDFEPDANLTKPAWDGVPQLTLEDFRGSGNTIPGVHTRVAVAYTKSRLYLAYWCDYIELNYYEDTQARQERWQLWDRDVVEVFINPLPQQMNTYWEFEVSPNNQWIDLKINLDQDPVLDASWNSGFVHATKVDEKRKQWTCEIGIPVSSMEIPRIYPGMEWRINFYRCDGIGDVKQRRLLAWSPTLDDSFHIPNRFGLIQFQP